MYNISIKCIILFYLILLCWYYFTHYTFLHMENIAGGFAANTHQIVISYTEGLQRV